MFVCMYLCIYVIAFVATPLNLQFEIWQFDCLKTVFSNVWKNVFVQSYYPFSVFLKDFSVSLKSNYAKINGDRKKIFFAHNSTRRRQKFKGEIFAQKYPDFFYDSFSFRLSPRLTIASIDLKFKNNILYVIILKVSFQFF